MIPLGILTLVPVSIVFSIRVVHLGTLMTVQMTIVTSMCITIYVYYLCNSFCDYLGYGALFYFGVYHSAGHSPRDHPDHLHIYSHFGHPLDGCYHNDHGFCRVCVHYSHGYVTVHRKHVFLYGRDLFGNQFAFIAPLTCPNSYS